VIAVRLDSGPCRKWQSEQQPYRSPSLTTRGTYHKYGISAIHWYPFDNGLITTSSYDETVKVFDTENWREACSFELGSKVYSHSISKIATHALIVTACDNPVMRLCDMRSGGYSHMLRGHTGKVIAVEWSPRQEHILASAGSDGTIRIWDVRKAQACMAMLDMYNSRREIRPAIPKAHADTVNGIAWTEDGLTLVSTGHDNKLRVWDVVTGENMLVNYGTAINNTHWQTVKPLIVEGIDIDDSILFYPSDEGQLLRYGLFNGYLFHRQFVLNGRVTCAVNRSNQHVELVTGDSVGQLIKWAPYETQEHKVAGGDQTISKDDALSSIVNEINTPTITFN
jgi:DNA excision repair protein ERCC-8